MKVGLTLSGGGARGIAHIGVLKVFEELGFKPDKIAGVSAGSIVGALYANGYSAGQILEIVNRVKLTDFFRPSAFQIPGLFSIERMTDTLLKYLPHNSFEKLKIPLTVSATDINAGEIVYFTEGELIKPILASSCVPLIFSPIRYQGKMLMDGGIMDSMIVEPLSDCEIIIAIHVNPFDKDQTPQSTLGVVARCFNLVMHSNARVNFSKCNLVIEPFALKDITPFSLNKNREIYQIGYKAAKAQEEELKKVLEKVLKS
jgi:NTE family protein